MTEKSILTYYQQQNFNPVEINIFDNREWIIHLTKRRNLYNCLGIPLYLLRGCSVLEFGCNSGENSIVFASMGANLTLVEPNHKVLDRLYKNFDIFNLKDRIISLHKIDIESFESNQIYDLVIAEGFLPSLPSRDELLNKLISFVAPGGFLSISFGNMHGMLIEMLRRLIFWRACHTNRIELILSKEALELAKMLFFNDFSRINASRKFEAWWQDSLVSPFFTWKDIKWSYHEIIPTIEMAGCEFFSSSPRWTLLDEFNWYKNVFSTRERHARLFEIYYHRLPYFWTGLKEVATLEIAPPKEVVNDTKKFIKKMAEYTQQYPVSSDIIPYPNTLCDYLNNTKVPILKRFSVDIQNLLESIFFDDFYKFLKIYQKTKELRNLWGVPYHYASFQKEFIS